jgi:hypothetical protein
VRRATVGASKLELTDQMIAAAKEKPENNPPVSKGKQAR